MAVIAGGMAGDDEDGGLDSGDAGAFAAGVAGGSRGGGDLSGGLSSIGVSPLRCVSQGRGLRLPKRTEILEFWNPPRKFQGLLQSRCIMTRQSLITVLGVALAFGLGLFVAGHPTAAPAQAQPPLAPRGRCIGIQAVIQTNGPPTVVRAFEDGTVDWSVWIPGQTFTEWKKIGS
jgi:hypothetical protein